MLAVVYNRHHADTGLVGSVSFTSPVFGTWTVPPGVWQIDVVCIGAGGNGIMSASSRSGGGGGGLVYDNNIAVTPGQVINYGVCDISTGGGPGATTFLGLTANRGSNGSTTATAAGGTATGGDVRFTGGTSTRRTGSTASGGSAAGYTANGTSNGGAGVGLTGTGSSGTFGRGGTSSNSSGNVTTGGTGAIRVMWGVGKSFPANAA